MGLKNNTSFKEGIANYFSDFKKNLILSKKYWVMFLILVLILSLSLFKVENYMHPLFEVTLISIVCLLGIFSIVTYFQFGDKELYKTVFIVIFIFGLLCCVLTPFGAIGDEPEHLYRAELTSSGVLFPEPVNGSFQTIESMHLFKKNSDITVFQSNWDTNKIDYNESTQSSVFQQNPFYGYLFSGIGVLFAKLLDLNVVWILWLGRIFNALMYATLISYAVKKTPIFKIPVFAIACLPNVLYSAFSASIDSFIFALGIVIITYFFYLCENKFTKKELAIFIGMCFLIGLCKVTYFGFILLLLFLPTENFSGDKKKFYLYCILGFVVVAVLGLLWTKLYASPAMMNSWRADYMLEHNCNVNAQIGYILSHLPEFIRNLLHTIPNSFKMFGTMFNFYSRPQRGSFCPSEFVNILMVMFLGFIFLGYPIEKKINLKAKIGALITFLVVYIGTFISFLLFWNPVGEFTYVGVQLRYFFPLFVLIPFICTFNLDTAKSKYVDKYCMVMIAFSIAALIISIGFMHYC